MTVSKGLRLRLKVLIACEESQRVCAAFRELGHEAYSCDIQEPSGGHPEWHIKGNVLDIIEPLKNVRGEPYDFIIFNTMDGEVHTIGNKWDLIIAHPPCTYLSNAGARHLYKGHALNLERYEKGLEAKKFFLRLYYADCEHIAVENPVPSKIYELPKYTQIIQPYEHGHPFKKKTCLWLKGLPKLQPTNIIPTEAAQSTRTAGNWYNKGGKDRQKNRAKTFEGIAKAMAEQWSACLAGDSL